MTAPLFPDSYAAARDDVLAAAKAAGARVESHGLPDRTGLQGETLAIDVAGIGAPDAPRTVFLLSGTHGVEGFVGSVTQTRLLRRVAEAALPADLQLVLIHGAPSPVLAQVNPPRTGGAGATRGRPA